MDSSQIQCPNCGHSFELGDVLTSRLRGEFEADFAKKSAAREAEIARQREALAAARQKVEEDRSALEQQVQERTREQLVRVKNEATALVRQELDAQLKDQAGALDAKNKALAELQKNEVELRRRARELEERGQALEVENARRLDEERAKIREEALKRAAEDHRLKDLEKDKRINDLMTSLEDMKRKAEQGSMETQGEVMEQDHEQSLKHAFPQDRVEPVPKGYNGADLVHVVMDSGGREAGVMLWEFKNTKAWSPGWLEKLRADGVQAKASFLLLVSRVLPEGVEHFALVDGVWVCSSACAAGLAGALRGQLLALAAQRAARENQGGKMEMLYAYLTGPEFRNRVLAVSEAFLSMKDQLEREKRAFQKIWADREKQLERVLLNTSGLYGDVQGIVGQPLQTIDALELPASPPPGLPGQST
jgi:hypothetical protein